MTLLDFSCILNFKLLQMDVKSMFLNGYIQEEVNVNQPPKVLSFSFPNHVLKMKKALYIVKQDTRAWHEPLSKFLLENNS